MSLLFITKYMSGDMPAIIMELKILLIPYIVVLVAMIIDLVFGIRKAKELGEARTSYGLRRSVLKFIEYYVSLICASLVDVIASVVEDYNLPYITFAVGLYLLVTESFSIREKAVDKARRKKNQDLKTIVTILEHRGDVVNTVKDILKQEIEKNEIKDDSNETNT